MSESLPGKNEYTLPVVTAETLEGCRGTIKGDWDFNKAETDFADRQEQLYATIAKWAQLEYGAQGADIALRATVLMHFLLSEQAAVEILREQHPDL